MKNAPPIVWIREALSRIRVHAGPAGRFASRFNRITRYGWDMVLWTHLLGRKRDPVPSDLPTRLLESKEIAFQPPALHVSGPTHLATAWEQGFAAVNAALLLNLQMPDVLSAVRYAHPAPAFQGVYLWDSAFTARVWNTWDTAAARDVLRAVVELRDGPRLQHVVADFVDSQYTQPPLLAWSAAGLLSGAAEHDDAFVRALLNPLHAYHEWLWKERQTAPGLFSWAHPYESGIDNAPRFSSRDESEFADTMRMASPDFAAYMVLQLEALADLASRSGDAAVASVYRDRRQQVVDATNDRLWHEDDGLYYDLKPDTGEMVRSQTIASLLPLWAGIPDQRRADRLKQWILDPQAFNTVVPLPTVSRGAPEFVKDMWRGPVWINTAYAVIQGMLRYGWLEEAADYAWRLCDGVYKTFGEHRRLFEFYDPDRPDITQLARKQGNRWKQMTLGSKPVTEFVGWTGLVNTLVCELLVGYTNQNGVGRLRPLLPKRSEGVALSLRLPQHEIAISVERDHDSRVRGALRTPRGVQRFDIALGETLEIEHGASQPLPTNGQS